MTGWVVYYDETSIYFTDKIENCPLFIPFDVEEAIFNTEEEMMEFVKKLENRG